MYIFCALKGTAIRILRFVAFRTNLSIYGTQRKTVPLLYIASTENRRNYCRYRQFIWVGQALTPKGGPINRPHGSSCLSGGSACKSSSNSAVGQPPGEKKWHWERQDMTPSGMERYGKNRRDEGNGNGICERSMQENAGSRTAGCRDPAQEGLPPEGAMIYSVSSGVSSVSSGV